MKPDYPGYKDRSTFVAKDIKYLKPKEKSPEYKKEFVSILTAMEVIIICSLCRKQKNIYHRLNESTFMQHVREQHLNKLHKALVAKCPVCNMEFNKVRTAEHHIQCNHKSDSHMQRTKTTNKTNERYC